METMLFFQSEKVISVDLQSTAKESALFKVVFGILKEWDLSQIELSVLLKRSQTTISDWKRKRAISFSKNLDMNDYQVLQFIELYKVLSNLFVLKKDQVAWLRDPNKAMSMKSPLKLIEEDPRHLGALLKMMNQLVNP